MKRSIVLLALLIGCTSALFSQRASLAGLKFCIDPGHGGHSDANDRHVIPDPGTNFYESESNFQKALALKPLLEAKGATVILTRYTNDYPNDADEPSLAARVQTANSNNVDWFHSIHSNALASTNTGTNYSMIMVREKVVPGGSDVYGPGTGQPQTQEAWNMADFLGPAIFNNMRTQRFLKVLDWTFYGGSNGGYTLGVLRGLYMPGELSEGEFHDYFPVTRCLMNLSYCKMEAYAIRTAFLQYFGVPADTLCIVAGVISELGTNKMIDGTRVRLLPENIVYNGDFYHNGFYMIDSVKAGVHTLRFETPGYRPDSLQITLTAGKVTFSDRQFESLAAPVVAASSPADKDTAFAASSPIQITFSKAMDTASVRTAIVMTPPVKGSLIWSNSNTVLTMKPDSIVLPFNITFVLRIEASARSQGGLGLDGNGDGVAGDAFQISFRTKPVDVWPPVLIAASPPTGSNIATTNSVLNFTFDEPLDPNSLTSSNVVVQEVGTGNRPLTLQYSEANGHGAVNVFPQGGFKPGRSYKVRYSGLTDVSGNSLPSSTPLWTFTAAPLDLQSTLIDDFSTSVAAWLQPNGSINTIGIDSASFARDTLKTLITLPSASKSARLRYYWNTKTATDWLISEYLNPASGRTVTWDPHGNKLQVYLFGDGSGTFFRFVVDDSATGTSPVLAQNHEVSIWTPITWVGWRLVEWDFDRDSVGTWTGDGKLVPNLRFDSFQLKYPPGSKITSGTIYFAQLQVVKGTVTAVEQTAASLPQTFELDQNFPNPFNPSTSISYQIGTTGPVSLKVFDMLGREIATIVNGTMTAGMHTSVWDGKDDRGEPVASGVYLYQLRAESGVVTKKMVLLK
ncbi:MAG TPA: Ig-like domain-containing protein [Bacteroidota bacterium]|nr:Ig-like domain-containing protein [Bacteroidota bacterium]